MPKGWLQTNVAFFEGGFASEIWNAKIAPEFRKIQSLISESKQEARCEFLSDLEKWADEKRIVDPDGNVNYECKVYNQALADLKAKLNNMQKWNQ